MRKSLAGLTFDYGRFLGSTQRRLQVILRWFLLRILGLVFDFVSPRESLCLCLSHLLFFAALEVLGVFGLCRLNSLAFEHFLEVVEEEIIGDARAFLASTTPAILNLLLSRLCLHYLPLFQLSQTCLFIVNLDWGLSVEVQL